MLPPLARDIGEPGEEGPVALGQLAAGLSVQVGGLEELAVRVELQLLHGAVADADRGRLSMSGEMLELAFGERALTADAVHDLEIFGAPGAGTLEPGLE